MRGNTWPSVAAVKIQASIWLKACAHVCLFLFRQDAFVDPGQVASLHSFFTLESFLAFSQARPVRRYSSALGYDLNQSRTL